MNSLLLLKERMNAAKCGILYRNGKWKYGSSSAIAKEQKKICKELNKLGEYSWKI